MSNFEPKKIDISKINDGKGKYNNGDGIQAETINALVEGVAFAQENGGSGTNITVDEYFDETSANPLRNSVITIRIDELQREIDNLSYKPIDITSFVCSPSIAEKGSTVTVSLAWSINRNPVTQTFDGSSLGVSVRSEIKTGVTTNKTYTLKATGGNGETDTSYASINFYNGVYYGVASEPTNYNSAFVLGLTKSLQSNNTKTFTVTAGAGQYIYYALPTSYDNPNFNVGGFDGGFTKVSTISFTNASGYTESYDIYKSDNANLGYTTVKVS